jgi:hypothetical protein
LDAADLTTLPVLDDHNIGLRLSLAGAAVALFAGGAVALFAGGALGLLGPGAGLLHIRAGLL